jgi:hypothetical protein
MLSSQLMARPVLENQQLREHWLMLFYWSTSTLAPCFELSQVWCSEMALI